jgi:NAD(P)-dependent dehydrogenase (short-subunit alcohol dehydrogenase family)
VEYRTLDLGSLAEVKSFGEKILKELDELHLLMNDAGVGVAPFGLTKDGLGNQ